jgi:hypothetical protein
MLWINQECERPVAPPESGPTHAQEFMRMTVTKSNEKDRHTSHISRVIFKE